MQNFSRQRHSINRVMNYMRSHVDRPINLDRLADVACLSKYHFIGVFHDHCQETPFEFLSRTRLEYAIDNLVYQPDQSITEVGLNCGFSNPQAFSRAFRQRYSVSPRSYRRANTWRFDQFPQNQIKANQVEEEFKQGKLNFPALDLTRDAVELRRIDETRIAYLRHVGLYTQVNYSPAYKPIF